MYKHLAVDLFMLALVLLVYRAIGTTGMTIALIALTVAHLATVAVVVRAVNRIPRANTVAENATEAAYQATANTLARLTNPQRALVATAWRHAVDHDPALIQLRHHAFRQAVYSGRIERHEKPGSRRVEIADWDETLPGAAAVLLAALVWDRLAPADAGRLTGWWAGMNLPLYSRVPATAAVRLAA